MSTSTDRVRVWAFAVCLLVCATGMRAGQVELISRVEPSLQSDTDFQVDAFYADAVSVSADGRWVAFTSRGPHLVPGQVNPPAQVHTDWNPYHLFLHDRISGETVLVDHAYGSPSTTANSASLWPQISADGRWVLFSSYATNLVAGFADASPAIRSFGGVNLFLYDRIAGTTRLVDHVPSSPTLTGNSYSTGAVMSSDGAWIAFTSGSTDLVDGYADGVDSADVFLYERATGAITLVSRRIGSPQGTANGSSWAWAITDDGGSVAFESSATDLFPGQSDTRSFADVFVWTRPTGSISLVSHILSSPYEAANGSSRGARMSQDARYVVFESSATNLTAATIASGLNVFLHDRLTGATTLASHAAGQPNQSGDSSSRSPQISANGRFIAFESAASDLVSGPSASYAEVFLFDRDTGMNTLVSHASGSATAGTAYLSDADLSDISDDGRYILFRSESDALAAGQVEPAYPLESYDLFLYDRTTGENQLVSHASGSLATAGGGDTIASALSPEGNWAAFVSSSPGLAAGVRDLNQDHDAFLHERATGENRLLSRRNPGTVASTPSGSSVTAAAPETSISADGRWVAFVSDAPNLVPGQIDLLGTDDVFLRDRASGVTWLVSRSASSPAAAGGRDSYGPVVTPDGRYVAFTSRSDQIVADQDDEGGEFGDDDVFLWDRVTGGAVLVSHTSSSPTTGGTADVSSAGSRHATVSDDGRYVAFLSGATDLVAGQIDDNASGTDVFLWDRDAPPESAVTLVSHVDTASVKTGPFDSGVSVISADGVLVAFASDSSLLAGQDPGDSTPRLYLFTRATGTVTLIADGHVATEVTAPVFSQDAAWLAFVSTAPDLVPGQQNPSPEGSNVFLWERATGVFTLVSRVAGTAATATGFSLSPDLSADGRHVVFESWGTDLVPGQIDHLGFFSDIFLFDRATGAMVLVSRSASSPVQAADGYSSEARISGDGRRVAFRSRGSDLLPGQSGQDGIYVFDRATGTNALASRTLSSATTTQGGASPVISADGLTVAFTSQGSDLVPGDFNRTFDAFAYTVAAPGLPGRFYTITPCRLLDSRNAGAAFASGARQSVTAHGVCGIPATATAVAANVTVTQTSDQGHLTLHAGDLPAPLTSMINFSAGQTRANNAILPLAANGAGTLAVTPFVLGGGSVHVIVDVTGYFE